MSSLPIKKKNNSGFTLIEIIVGFIVIGALTGGIYVWQSKNNQPTDPSSNENEQENIEPESIQEPVSQVSWSFDGTSWQSSSTPPGCTSPLIMQAPTNLSAATSILYPGQTRGGNYKPHGGFRFDTSQNEDVIVTAPFDAYLVQGSRYIEKGEVQYLLEFVHPCGISYRFDHLLTLATDIATLADSLPQAQVDDSRTTFFNEPLFVKQGDVIATAVGFKLSQNVAVDWGVYDLRSKNEASQDPTWANEHDIQLAHYAVCWFDLLSEENATLVKSLPPGDSTSGSQSDYCT